LFLGSKKGKTMSNQWFVKSSEKEGRSKVEIIKLYLSRAGIATTAEIADCLDCTPNTARKWLYRMAKEGIVDWNNHYYGRGIYLMKWCLR
jgi:predicted ArsR family transcriptional regulator